MLYTDQKAPQSLQSDEVLKVRLAILHSVCTPQGFGTTSHYSTQDLLDLLAKFASNFDSSVRVCGRAEVRQQTAPSCTYGRKVVHSFSVPGFR